MRTRLSLLCVFLCVTFPLRAADEIHTAAWSGNAKKIDEVVKAKPELANSKDAAGLTPLHLAAVLGQTDAVAALLAAKADVNSKDESGRTALHLAAAHGALAIAQQLITHGAALDEKDKLGMTPLHCAALSGETETAKLLIEKGAKLDEATTAWPWQGQTPLALAVSTGADDVVALLLEKNAATVYKDQELTNLLQRAVGAKSIVTLQRLIKLGKIDVNAGNHAKRTALQFACESHWIDGCKALLEAGANPNLLDVNGNTPLHTQSVFSGSMEFAQLLLKYKADPNLQGGKEMITCLHLAVSWGGHAELIPVLLEHGANPNLKNSAGQTPLHAACEHGYKENAKLLLDKGADTGIKDNKGMTPAEFAHQNTRIGKDFFELLEKYTKK